MRPGWTPTLAALLAGFMHFSALAQDSGALQARALAASCANCHGTNGQARGEMKTLAGMPASGLISTMAAYKSGAQPATVMHQIAKGYTDEQIRLVAEYFARQSTSR